MRALLDRRAFLGAIGTSMRFRAHVAPPLTDFADDEP